MATSEETRSLLIYIPTWDRPKACITQVGILNWQRMQLAEELNVRIMVSVNGDSRYNEQELRRAGADVVIQLPANLGASTNVCMGLTHLSRSQYVWVVSDDDVLAPKALRFLASALAQEPAPDLVLLAEVEHGVSVLPPDQVDGYEGVPLGLLSAGVYRGSTFAAFVNYAFDAIHTYFPHVGLLQAAHSASAVERVVLLPIGDVVDLSPVRKDAEGHGRRGMGERTGAYFFGGGLLAYMESDPALRRRRTRTWWRTHWHRVSMYRLADSSNQRLVDGLGRSSLATLGWWILSLPPWWRLKDVVPTRKERGPGQLP